jgi:hypothetical protein
VAARRGAGEKVNETATPVAVFRYCLDSFRNTCTERHLAMGIFSYIYSILLMIPLTIKYPPQSSFNLINNRLIPCIVIKIRPEHIPQENR